MEPEYVKVEDLIINKDSEDSEDSEGEDSEGGKNQNYLFFQICGIKGTNRASLNYVGGQKTNECIMNVVTEFMFLEKYSIQVVEFVITEEMANDGDFFMIALLIKLNNVMKSMIRMRFAHNETNEKNDDIVGEYIIECIDNNDKVHVLEKLDNYIGSDEVIYRLAELLSHNTLDLQ
jgi:hypothetical protein